MRATWIIASLLASLVLVGCGGKKQEAKAPEANPWADYKGTYAGAGEAEGTRSAETKPKASQRDAKAMAASTSETKPADDAAASAPTTAAAPATAPAGATRKAPAKKPGKAGAKKANARVKS